MILFHKLLRLMSGAASLNGYAKTCQAMSVMPEHIDLSKDKSEVLDKVQKILTEGGVVAVPTDTVYGIISLHKFTSKLFVAKKRSPTKPIALFVKSPDVIKRYAEQTIDDKLLRKLLPGKVTLLFRRDANIEDNINFNTDLIAFRIPDDEFIQQLCSKFEEPIAQTSANLSGEPSAIKPEEFKSIWETLDMIVVDSKRQMDERRIGSTIIDLSEAGTYHIKREGCSLAHYEKILRESNLRSR
ncbi:YrdC-like domain-containing protein [Aphelenchoides bicaudatus]|nr:YrdC-like domain-containing protein [Aphelenchoides bicaudatus]